MKYYKLYLLTFSLIVSSGIASFAQSRLGFYIGGGTTWYYGDMNDRIFTHKKLFRYYFNGGLLYRVNNKFDVSANFLMGKIAGADSLAIQDYNLKRNLNFESDIMEISVLGNYYFIGRGMRFNPYLIGGAGYLTFDPVGDQNGEKIKLHDLGTEGQYINGDGYPKPYKLYTLSVPIGLGIEIPISKAFAVRLEYANHFTFTDYLDDLSSDYADSSKLASTPNGAVAVQMASNLTTGYPADGYGRGNPKQSDTFSRFGVSLLYTPVSGQGVSRGKGVFTPKRKKNKKTCPAYH